MPITTNNIAPTDNCGIVSHATGCDICLAFIFKAVCTPIGSAHAYGRKPIHEVNFSSAFAMCPAATTTAIGKASRRHASPNVFAPPPSSVSPPSNDQITKGQTTIVHNPCTQPLALICVGAQRNKWPAAFHTPVSS